MIPRQVGIEVEIESIGRSYNQITEAMLSTNWMVERDGSLRNDSGAAFEVKSAGPIMIADLQPHLAQLYPVLADSSGSWRAAVHVHVNVLDLSWVQRALALGLAYAADLPLFAAFSPERVQSNFCVPLSHKQAGVFECMAGMVLQHGLISRYGKYSSVNIGRLNDLGTFEFRHLRTPKCGDSVAEVTQALGQIRRYAMACASIVQHAQSVCRDRASRRIALGDTLAGEFIALAESMPAVFLASMGARPIELDRDAIGEVVTLFAGMQSYDPVELDLATLVRAAGPRPPRLRRMEIDAIFEEMESQHDPDPTEGFPDDRLDALGMVVEQTADGLVMRYRDTTNGQPF